jgi:hypothetical protein
MRAMTQCVVAETIFLFVTAKKEIENSCLTALNLCSQRKRSPDKKCIKALGPPDRGVTRPRC